MNIFSRADEINVEIMKISNKKDVEKIEGFVRWVNLVEESKTWTSRADYKEGEWPEFKIDHLSMILGKPF